MKKFVSVLLALLACIAFSGIAHAASVTTSLQVSVNLVPACQVSASSVNFGDVLWNTDSFANGDVSVNCPQDTAYNIALDAGSNFYDFRRVYNGSSGYIQYRLYKDSAYTLEWGDSDYAGTYIWGSSLADTGNGLSQSHTVYGKLFGAGVPVGSYSDTVTVTVYF
jgi:spore coat protein U-like protein